MAGKRPAKEDVMLFRKIVGLFVLTLIALPAGASAEPMPPVPVPLDGQVVIDGVQVGCTGIGTDARDDPRWQAYPVRVEAAEVGGDYLAYETVTLASAGGPPIFSVRCEGPWVLFKLPAGRTYNVEGRADGPAGGGAIASAHFRVPSQGQARVVLRFPLSR
jgi:hypothetical protein